MYAWKSIYKRNAFHAGWKQKIELDGLTAYYI